jgi:hypothetical protein
VKVFALGYEAIPSSLKVDYVSNLNFLPLDSKKKLILDYRNQQLVLIRMV